jgi:carboxymethylenebutenolidase
MCFDHDSHPPIAPVTGAATDHHRSTLKASDGNEFAVYEAFSEGGARTGVVVLPDVRGLYHFYEELAVRLAEAGHDAIAIDYFGRTAGIGDRSDAFPYHDHVPLVTDEGLTADVGAAVARLRQGNADRAIFVLGFCFGGSSAWQQTAHGHGLAGGIGFYGRPDGRRPQGAKTPIELAPEMASPILALMGGDDPGIPAETVALFENALTKAGVEHEIVTYDGAPHSFFDRKYDEYADESADAWRRALEFIRVNSG